MPPKLNLTMYELFQLEYADVLVESLKKFGKLNDEQKELTQGGTFLSHHYEGSGFTQREISLAYAKHVGEDLPIEDCVAAVLEEFKK